MAEDEKIRVGDTIEYPDPKVECEVLEADPESDKVKLRIRTGPQKGDEFSGLRLWCRKIGKMSINV